MLTARLARRLIIVLCISAFGPYLLPAYGLRLDQIVIYGAFLCFLPVVLISRRFRANVKPLLVIALFLIFAATWMLVVSIFDSRGVDAKLIIAGFESVVQPAALLMVLAVMLSDRTSAECLDMLLVSIRVTLFLLALNTIVSLLTTTYDTWPFVRYFVGTISVADGGSSVWELAASMGRYSGIFNQPFENGLAYSIGLVCWVYWVSRSDSLSVQQLLLLVMLVIGGVMSVSKVFIVGGIPLAAAYWFTIPKKNSPLKLWHLIVLGGAYIAVSALLTTWDGLDFLLRLFNPAEHTYGKGLLDLYTAGRFGSGSTVVEQLFAEAWQQSPLYGFGYGAFTPLDNGYLEFFYQGGIVSIFAYVVILVLLLVMAAGGMLSRKACGSLLMALWILILGAGIGAPVLTINRSSVFLWVIVSLAICGMFHGRVTRATSRISGRDRTERESSALSPIRNVVTTDV